LRFACLIAPEYLKLQAILIDTANRRPL